MTKSARRRYERKLAELRKQAGTYKGRRSTGGQIRAAAQADIADMRTQIAEHRDRATDPQWGFSLATDAKSRAKSRRRVVSRTRELAQLAGIIDP